MKKKNSIPQRIEEFDFHITLLPQSPCLSATSPPFLLAYYVIVDEE